MTCPVCGTRQAPANDCSNCGAVTWNENPENRQNHQVEQTGPSHADAFAEKYNKPSYLGVGVGVAVLLFGGVPFVLCLINGWWVGYCLPVMLAGVVIIGRSLSSNV
jgi:hypothetical protein